MPVLWDKKESTIVNNESSEIIRIFNTAFNDLITPEQAKLDIFPVALQKEIESVNGWVYDGINSACFAIHAGLSPMIAMLLQTACTSRASRHLKKRTRRHAR